MKHMLVCAMLAVSVFLGGCAGSEVYRGLDASNGAFVSTYSPSVSVQPAEGYENVLSGYTLCRVPFENGFANSVSTSVWFSLYKSEGSQLVAMLAECPIDLIWELSPVAVDYRLLKVYYESNGVNPNDATVHVYVRPVNMDPWTPLYIKAGKAEWQGNTLVARYEWTSSTEKEKLVVEYREPAPQLLEGMSPKMTDLSAFIERSRKAFALDSLRSPVSPVQRVNVLVPDITLAPVVGAVSGKQMLLF